MCLDARLGDKLTKQAFPAVFLGLIDFYFFFLMCSLEIINVFSVWISSTAGAQLA